ncbi:MAG: DUF998 domain-containing protein [Actinokineospora sp.]
MALIGGWTIAAARTADFNSVRDTISALAAINADERWIMTTGLAITGICHIVTATGLRSTPVSARVVLAVGGVATAAVAVFPQPSETHAPVAAAAFGLMSVWPLLAGTRRSRIAGLILLTLLAAFGLSLRAERWVGLSERVLAAAQSLWPAVVAFHTPRTLSR